MPEIQFAIQSYKSDSLEHSAQQLVNMFAEKAAPKSTRSPVVVLGGPVVDEVVVEVSGMVVVVGATVVVVLGSVVEVVVVGSGVIVVVVLGMVVVVVDTGGLSSKHSNTTLMPAERTPSSPKCSSKVPVSPGAGPCFHHPTSETLGGISMPRFSVFPT